MAGYNLGDFAAYEWDPGEFIHRVSVFVPVLTPDGYGGFNRVLPNTPTHTLYAKVETLKASEYRMLGQNVLQATHKIAIHHRTGMEEDWVLEWRGIKMALKGWHDIRNMNRLTCLYGLQIAPNVV